MQYMLPCLFKCIWRVKEGGVLKTLSQKDDSTVHGPEKLHYKRDKICINCIVKHERPSYVECVKSPQPSKTSF